MNRYKQIISWTVGLLLCLFGVLFADSLIETIFAFKFDLPISFEERMRVNGLDIVLDTFGSLACFAAGLAVVFKLLRMRSK